MGEIAAAWDKFLEYAGDMHVKYRALLPAKPIVKMKAGYVINQDKLLRSVVYSTNLNLKTSWDLVEGTYDAFLRPEDLTLIVPRNPVIKGRSINLEDDLKANSKLKPRPYFTGSPSDKYLAASSIITLISTGWAYSAFEGQLPDIRKAMIDLDVSGVPNTLIKCEKESNLIFIKLLADSKEEGNSQFPKSYKPAKSHEFSVGKSGDDEEVKKFVYAFDEIFNRNPLDEKYIT